jgi:hypothetical protein
MWAIIYATDHVNAQELALLGFLRVEITTHNACLAGAQLVDRERHSWRDSGSFSHSAGSCQTFGSRRQLQRPLGSLVALPAPVPLIQWRHCRHH